MSLKPSRPWFVPGRRGLLLGALALVIALLALNFGDLLLAYRMAEAKRAIRERQFDLAVEALKRAESPGRRSATWHYVLACAQRRGGNLPDAGFHLASAEDLGFDQSEVARQRLLMRAQSGEIKEVEAQLASLLQTDLSDEAAEETYEAMARGFMASFHLADARKCLTYWIEWQPDNTLARLWMADVCERIEQRPAALAEYERVLELDPWNAEACHKLAELYLEMSDLDRAAPLFERCLNASDRPGPCLMGLAECRRRQGAVEEARSLLYEALLHELTDDEAGQAVAELGQIAMEERDHERAIAMLEQSVTLAPHTPRSRLALAGALIAAGQEQLAEPHRQAASELVNRHHRLISARRRVVTEPNNADLRCEVGLILMESGLPSAGAQWLLSALQIDSQHPAARRALAAYFESIGNVEQAQRYGMPAEVNHAQARNADDRD